MKLAAVKASSRQARQVRPTCLICREEDGVLVRVVIGRHVHVVDCLARWVAASRAERVFWREAAPARVTWADDWVATTRHDRAA
jgi:hypothetical protein